MIINHRVNVKYLRIWNIKSGFYVLYLSVYFISVYMINFFFNFLKHVCNLSILLNLEN